MAVGVDVIKTTGRLVFELERDEEQTARTLEIPDPLITPEDVQAAINETNTRFTSTADQMNVFIQPANWRDNNNSELQWTTKKVRYEIVQTVTTPVEPDEVLSAAMAKEEEQQEREERGEQHEQEQNDQQQNEPQGEWQG